MQKNHQYIILGVILIISALFLHNQYRTWQQNKRATETQIIAVAAATATPKNVNTELQVIGTVQPYSTVAVKSLVDGQLLKVNFQEGQIVQKDQPLFLIDPRPFQVSLQQAQANLAHDQAQLWNAQLNMERYAKLVKKGYVAPGDYDQQRANAISAQATVQADQAAIANAQLQIDYTNITAPITGRTGSILVNPGNIIKTGNNTVLVNINQLSPIYVVFSIPEQYLSAILAHQTQTPVKVNFDDPQLTPEQGVVSFIDNNIDTTTGTIQFKATFDNTNQHLWPGQFVRVTLPAVTLNNVIIIPARAVLQGQQGSYVYVIKPDNTVTYRTVTTGPSVTEGIVITHGLKAGEQVVTDGQIRLQEGTPVHIGELPDNDEE